MNETTTLNTVANNIKKYLADKNIHLGSSSEAFDIVSQILGYKNYDFLKNNMGDNPTIHLVPNENLQDMFSNSKIYRELKSNSLSLGMNDKETDNLLNKLFTNNPIPIKMLLELDMFDDYMTVDEYKRQVILWTILGIIKSLNSKEKTISEKIQDNFFVWIETAKGSKHLLSLYNQDKLYDDTILDFFSLSKEEMDLGFNIAKQEAINFLKETL